MSARSAESISAAMCVDMRTLVPFEAMSRNARMSEDRWCGSRPAVGSSRSSTSGSWTMPAATMARRCIPPEIARRRVVLCSSKPIIRKALTAWWRAVARSIPRSHPTSATKSTARCAGSKTLRCGTQPIRCRHESERRTSSPPTKMVPVGGRSSPAMSCMRVLFPAPFAPRRTVNSGARSKDISRTTSARAE